jgi:hypothetical protein
MAWATLAAAALPAAIDIGRELLSDSGDEDTDPGQADRRALHQQLMSQSKQGALEQPGAQAAMEQLRRITERQRRTDQATLAKQGAGGTERAIAQSARRGRNQAQGMLDVVQQGQQQKRAALQQAMSSANTKTGIWNRKQAREQKRKGRLMGLLGQGAMAATQAFAGGGGGGSSGNNSS